jgi:hypothetical protein
MANWHEQVVFRKKKPRSINGQCKIISLKGNENQNNIESSYHPSQNGSKYTDQISAPPYLM